MTSYPHRVLRLGLVICAAAFISACSSLNPFSDSDDETVSNQPVNPGSAEASLAGNAAGSPANPFMWQAALEAVGFMPLETVDEPQGLIKTDWYIPPGAPLERFRIDVAFSSRALRAESMQLLVGRQQLNDIGQWQDVRTNEAVPNNLIDSIIARALVLRQESGSL